MAIDKGLYQAPKGLEELAQSVEPDIEIEIEDPEAVRIKAGDLEFGIEKEEEVGGSEEFNANLVEEMDEGALESLASDLAGSIDDDIASRKDWEQMYKDGITLLGLKFEERTEPWDGACGVFSTLLTEAAIRFQSESIMETFPAAGPVKTQIIGQFTPEIEEDRKSTRLNSSHT